MPTPAVRVSCAPWPIAELRCAPQDPADSILTQAVARLTTLTRLTLSDHTCCYLDDSSPLAALTQLRSFSRGIKRMDVADLPASLTQLRATCVTLEDSYAAHKRLQEQRAML